MNKQHHTKAKRIFIALAAVAALGGCAVVPYDSGYYQQGYVEPVYVAPVVSLGIYGSSGRGYYGPRYGHRGGRGYGHGYHRRH